MLRFPFRSGPLVASILRAVGSQPRICLHMQPNRGNDASVWLAASVLRYELRPAAGLNDWVFAARWRAASASISAGSNQNVPGTPRKDIIDRALGLCGNPTRWPGS